MLKKWLLQAGLVLAGVILLSGIASAHVVVYPQETTQGTYEKFTVRVPTEKDVPTTKVQVKFDTNEVAVSRFEPKPGWTYEISKDDSGKINGVTWTAAGDGLGSTEFGEFNMQGKVGDAATQITWKAYQTYKDGSVVEWVGTDGSDKPASVTTVKAKAASASTDSHNHAAATSGDAAANGSGSSTATLALAIVGVVLGALALIVALMRKRA